MVHDQIQVHHFHVPFENILLSTLSSTKGVIQKNHNWLMCLPSNTMARIREGKFPLPEENEMEECGDEKSSLKAIPQNRDFVQRLGNPPWGLTFLQQALNSNAPGWIQNGNWSPSQRHCAVRRPFSAAHCVCNQHSIKWANGDYKASCLLYHCPLTVLPWVGLKTQKSQPRLETYEIMFMRYFISLFMGIEKE